MAVVLVRELQLEPKLACWLMAGAASGCSIALAGKLLCAVAGPVTYTGGAVNVAVTGAGPAAAYVAGAISVVAAGAVTYTGGAV